MMEKKYQLVAWTTNITDKESAKLQMIPSLESEIRASLISDLSDIHKEDYRCGYRISIGMARRAMLACEKLSRYYIFTGRYADGIRYLFFAAQYCVRGNLMQEFRKTLQDLPFIAKLLLVIFYDIYGALVRICKGDTTGLIVGILQLVTGNFFGIFWIIDLVTVITKKEVTFLA